MTRIQADGFADPIWSDPKTDAEGMLFVEDGRHRHVDRAIRASRTAVKESVCEYTRTSGPSENVYATRARRR